LHLRLCFDSTGDSNAEWGKPLDCRFGCRATKPVVLTIVGAGFRGKHFRYVAAAGRHSVRREDVKRLNDLERETATRKRVLAEAELETVALKELGVSEQWRLLRPCGVGRATAPRTIRDGGFGARITTPAQKAGQSMMSQPNAFGAMTGFDCHNAAGPQSLSPGTHHWTGLVHRGPVHGVPRRPLGAAARIRTLVSPLRAAEGSRSA
jgi:hypothetical protein